MAGDASKVTAFRVTRRGGAVLARRKGSSARGAWIALRRGAVTVSALAADGSVLARFNKTL